MQFINNLKDNLDDLEIYHFLEDEMSKYKTLNHENIKWNKVYEYSLEILQHFSLDARIYNYFVLSCMALNNEESFRTMNGLFESLADILQNYPNALDKDTDIFNMQAKKMRSIIEHFITEADKLNISHFPKIIADLNYTFRLLGEVLGHNFKEIQAKQDIQKNEVIPLTNKQTESYSQNPNITSLNDREYRTFFIHLAFELLENNIENLNAYAMFIEAMWGRIKVLPTHNENITQIKYPEKNLIQALLQSNLDELEHTKCFMSNLALNPFWLEGLKFFCEFLQNHKKINASKVINILAMKFLTKFGDISNLKFSNGKFMCEYQVLDYFLQQDINFNHKTSKTNKNEEDGNVDKILLDINARNNNSLFSHINTLIEMANIFEDKNMHNNAKILYIQIKDLMERTLLKDYLLEDYLKIKVKSEKIQKI